MDKQISRVILFMNQHPTRFAAMIIVGVLLPVWWLTGDYSPLP